MPWRGIDDLIDAYGRMRVRVHAETAAAAVDGARVIKEAAQANILQRFIQRSGNLWRSMTYDDVARQVGEDDFVARAFPRGPGSVDGTPYGRIQELGGVIRPREGNKTGKLWFQGLRANGTFGWISVFEVELEGQFYLRDAVFDNLGELRNTAARHWRDAL